MKRNIYKQSFWEFGSFFGEVFLGFTETFWEVLFHHSTLALKNSTGSQFLWKQKQNIFSKVTYPWTQILKSRHLHVGLT